MSKTAKLLRLYKKVASADQGSPQLDQEFAKIFVSAPGNVTRSLDLAVSLVESELPRWWWTCGYCKLSNDASIYVPGSEGVPYAYRQMLGQDFKSGPEELRLLMHPRMGKVFQEGFHTNLIGGTIPLALMTAFLEAKIALAKVD